MNEDRLFVDANILLEIILSRKNEKLARDILKDNSNRLFISALTAHLVVHFGQSIVDLPILRSFLGDYTILALNESDFEWAFTNMRNQDFEDALQLAVAIRNGCDTFITLDKDLATNYNNLPQIKTTILS